MLQTGSFLADRYEIIEKIGTGGMSDVYRAVDQVLSREVAVKVLKEEFAEDENFVSKFRSEAQNAARLEHPNIVNIYDVGSEDGLYYIIMEYVEGITLKTYIEKKGHLNYKEVISIAIQVGRGIESAHKNHIIHRDIKPQNIIISKEGKVKVTDFGIARAASGKTVSAEAMGSVHYISPEQARNGYVTERSDIYSLGIVMYEMATGSVPFDGDTAVSVALKHLQGEMTPPSKLVEDIPVALERIIIKATMKSPERRYADVDELLIDLKKALVTPDEDFVVIPDPNDTDKTKVITKEDLDKIREQSEPDMSDLEDDDDEDDDKLNPKMEKAVTIMSIAAAVIIALVVIYMIGSIFGWFKFSSKSNKEDTKVEEEAGNIKVPDLLGKSKSEVKELLKEKGLKFDDAGTRASEKYKKGTACYQNIKEGVKVKKNTKIRVAFSSGKSDKEVEVPSVVGMTERQAISALDEAGFESTVSYSESDSVEQGKVISQSPNGNAKAEEGSTVKIVVSQGKKQVQVPHVAGVSEADARNTISAAGLNVVVSYETDDNYVGKVIRQTPDGGFVNSGDTITVVVGKASEKPVQKEETKPSTDNTNTNTGTNTGNNSGNNSGSNTGSNTGTNTGDSGSSDSSNSGSQTNP
ncbi:MAG: Stk1 family PASTA domain-containing Ser/Thr kinase [Lachnospiraceae bacterium]|nr:Stk1 family PASTA domain-containing Ser/Thr kinase [Lachnospiraceae bacterium]